MTLSMVTVSTHTERALISVSDVEKSAQAGKK